MGRDEVEPDGGSECGIVPYRTASRIFMEKLRDELCRRAPVSALLETMHDFGSKQKQCGRIVNPEQE